MIISSATIDCWLYVGGRTSLTGGVLTDRYFDYQHHHWVLMPSAPIDSGNNNTPSCTWTFDGNGYDPDGSWSTLPVSKTSQTTEYRVRQNSPNTILLTQTQGYGTNTAWANGSNSSTSHAVSELIWPTLTWSSTLNTPSSINVSEGRPPHIIYMWINGKRVQKLSPGFGGEDYTTKTQFFQKPAIIHATAWWSWTINLS
jgi:hypothetical protein